MEISELEKSKAVVTVEILDYAPDSVLCRSVIKRITGSITVMAFDSGKVLTERISPFDTFAQVIDGHAEVMIDGNAVLLETGQSIILPAHKPNLVRASGRCKVILTIIKSGYE